MSNGDDRVKVYGTDWCHATRRTLRHLEKLGVPHRYINTEQDPEAAQWVRDHNRGLEMKPTLDIEGEVLSTPPERVLDGVLQAHGLLR